MPRLARVGLPGLPFHVTVRPGMVDRAENYPWPSAQLTCSPKLGPPERGTTRVPARSRAWNPSIPSVARPLRYLPPDCPLVEVTCRTIQGRMLLRPSRELKRRILGVLARAAKRYEVGVCTFIYLSNHCRAPRGANLPCGLRGPPGSAAADPKS